MEFFTLSEIIAEGTMKIHVFTALALCALLASPASATPRHHHRPHYTKNSSNVIGGRPSGCPHAFCGCGAALRIFGRIIPSLNLAANWLRFPRVEPQPNAVAVRRHHVFVLEQHISGKLWLVHDSNSGGHRTRLHPRSIAGYVIVDPRRG